MNLKATQTVLNEKNPNWVTFFAMAFGLLVTLTFGELGFAQSNTQTNVQTNKALVQKRTGSKNAKMASLKTNKNIMSTDQLAQEKPTTSFAATVAVSRSTSLYDHKDGTRSDSLQFVVIPVLKTSIGSFSYYQEFNQDLRDDQNSGNGVSDASIKYSAKATDWEWSYPYVLTMTPSLSVVVPMAKTTTVKQELETGISAGISFGIRPDGLVKKDGTFSLAIGLTAGRNIHKYQEDINGAVLNKYSSNQSLALGYSISDWSFGVEVIHKSRWTYQGKMREYFAAGQEIGYSMTDHFSIAVGHSNEANALSTSGNAADLKIVDENTSEVYTTLSASF